MALSLEKYFWAPPTAEGAGQSPNRHPFAMAESGPESQKNVRKLAN
jgi:hypothetical protein